MGKFSHVIIDKFPHVLIICAIAVSRLIAANDEPRDHTAVLSVKAMDCPAESMPAINELSKVRGVRKVVANYATRTLTITPKANAFPDPLALWEAAEKAKVQPVRLSTAHGVFNEKPHRQ